jgi:hypothetical protein
VPTYTNFNLIGLGADLSVNDGSGGSGSAHGGIADINSLTIPDPEYGFVERKPLSLPSRIIRKKVTLAQSGQLQFQYEYSRGKKARLDALIATEREFKVTIPAAGTEGTGILTRTFTGFITSNKIDPVVSDGIVTATCTVELEGAITDAGS